MYLYSYDMLHRQNIHASAWAGYTRGNLLQQQQQLPSLPWCVLGQWPFLFLPLQSFLYLVQHTSAVVGTAEIGSCYIYQVGT